MHKILHVDLETSPGLGRFFGGRHERYISEVLEHSGLMCFAFNWEGENKVTVHSLPDFNYKEKPLVKKLWELFDEAEIIIAHNCDSFDAKVASTFFIKHGLTPPSPYKTVDTLKIARKFKFTSNKLDDLGEELGLGRKNKTDYDLWRDCMARIPSAWKRMTEYNKQDVILLKNIYHTFLPWISNHPNVNVMEEKTGACPNCSSTHLQKRGYGTNSLTKYQRLQCQDCGRWSKGPAIKTEVTIR